jgi:hypothetical protein
MCTFKGLQKKNSKVFCSSSSEVLVLGTRECDCSCRKLGVLVSGSSDRAGRVERAALWDFEGSNLHHMKQQGSEVKFVPVHFASSHNKQLLP